MTAVVVTALIAAGLRLSVALHEPEALLDDPDAYWRYARQLWFQASYGGSAFRPPLYPALLAPCWAFGPYRWLGAAVLHAILGAVAAGAAAALSGRLTACPRAAWLTGTVVALDPLLLYWSGKAMSETAATALASLAMAWLALAGGKGAMPAVAGAAAGVAALCRPELGAGLAVASGWYAFTEPASRRGRAVGLVLFGMASVLSPWTLRNARLSGHFVPLTTHGGYTALLGNNPQWYSILQKCGVNAYYRDEELRSWQRQLRQQFVGWLQQRRHQPRSRLEREVYYDRYCYSRAFETILSDSRGFLRAVFQRLWALWKPMPSDRYAVAARVACGIWYVALYVAVAVGTVRLSRTGARHVRRWLLAAALLAATITGVHVLYWCDMRMRSPLIPALAVLAAGCCPGLRPVGLGAAQKDTYEGKHHGTGTVAEDPGPRRTGVKKGM